MLCPCCGVPVIATEGSRAMGSAIPPRARRRGGHRRWGDYAMSGAEADRELVELLARFGLVDAGDLLRDMNHGKAD